MTLEIYRGRPSRLADGRSKESQRAGSYAEGFVLPAMSPRHVLADEGSYYVGTNPTAGTGVAGHAAPTSMDNTKAFIVMKNDSSSDQGIRVYLDYIRLRVTAAGTAGTLNYATHLIDSGAGYTSGGSSISVVQPNGAASQSSVVSSAKVGAATVTANSGSQRIVSHAAVRTVIPVVGDVIVFQFGGPPSAVGSAQATAGAAQLERYINCPPIILAPGDWYKLILWRASQSAAASYELEMGWWER